MKKLTLIITLFITLITFAQSKQAANVDKIETTEIKTMMVEKNGNMIEQKIKTNTKKTMPIKFKEKANGTLVVADTPTRVVKTISVDNDKDPFYDTKTKLVYYTFDNKEYVFRPSPNGFIASIKTGDTEVKFGKAIRLTSNNNYLLETDTYTGVGFFNDDGNFVIEYYDGDSDGLVKVEYLIK